MLFKLLVLVLCVRLAFASSESYELEYFANATFHCNFTLHKITYPGLVAPFKKYWILPNATILPDTFVGDEKYSLAASPFDLVLTINAIDDPDFGVYHCIMIWNNIDYKIDAIRVGLNERGPYYKAKLEEFERNVIIGCASAGAIVLIILILCIACHCRCGKAKKSETTSTRNVNVYAVDQSFAKHGYDVRQSRYDSDDERCVTRDATDAGEEYASVKASKKDHVTLQSAHL